MRAELVTLTASVFINAGILYSMDHAVTHYDQAVIARHRAQAARQNADALNFEFVEAPPVAHAERPKNTRKISDRDALNQDLTKDKTQAETAPNIKTPGLGDQLAQKRTDQASAPSKPSPEVAAKPPLLKNLSPALLESKAPKPAGQGPPVEQTSKERTETTETSLVSQKPSPAIHASPSSPPVEGLTGHDRITTSEVSRSRSHGAQIYGVTSFEATGSGMGQYIKNMKERIWLAWFPYLLAHYPKDFKTADALIGFTLDAKGQVRIIKIIESTGSPLFSAFCMESIQRASPFGPLPQEILDLMGKDELEIKFAFHYW